MVSYSGFENYGLTLRFGVEVEASRGRLVPGTSIRDIRAQALRLSPEEYVKRLENPFEPKFSAGVWFFAGGSSRFHLPYKRDLTVQERLDIAAEMAPYGLRAVEAHYPWEINEENIDLYRDLEKRVGIKVSVVGGIGGDFRQVDAQFGTTSSVIKEVRDKYVEATVKGLKLVKELEAVGVSWPGIDVYTYPLGTHFYDMWDRFESALAEA
ncbi:MAG: hypothetical protein QW172_02720, partial [Candidatus Bathyarchaeia archaeon]